MSNDSTPARSAESRLTAETANLRMRWAMEVGPGRGLVARWDTTDEKRRRAERSHRRSAA